MGRPVVAIVGRANVGKSTLFNRIVRKRRAVIEDFPGITRDRLYGEASWEGRSFLVVDTGGFQHVPEFRYSGGGDGSEIGEAFSGEIKKQVFLAVEEAEIVMVMMDGQSGILPLDIELIKDLRKFGKKLFCVVNKVDGASSEDSALSDFYVLGESLYPVSALNGYGCESLMDALTEAMPLSEKQTSSYPRIAIVGRPNVGKSTIVNALLSKDRMIVSPVPGTTRDAVDSVCSYYSKNYVLVDTAGIRRKGRMARTVERYSFLRTLKNIEECDVALIVLDASDGVVELDLKIAGLVHEAGKGAVIVLNKWDAVDKEVNSVDTMTELVHGQIWFMRYAPVVSVSALTKQRITRIFPMVDDVMKEASKRISTSDLNVLLRQILSRKEPPMHKGRRVKIYYMTQVKTTPPGFVIFTNSKAGIKEQYKKFIERQIREKYSFEGVTVNIYIRQRQQK